MPLKARDLALVEMHFIEEILRHSHVPHSDLTVFASAREHMLVHSVKSATVERFFANLALDDTVSSPLSQVPSVKVEARLVRVKADLWGHLHFIKAIIATCDKLVIVVRRKPHVVH